MYLEGRTHSVDVVSGVSGRDPPRPGLCRRRGKVTGPEGVQRRDGDLGTRDLGTTALQDHPNSREERVGLRRTLLGEPPSPLDRTQSCHLRLDGSLEKTLSIEYLWILD